MTVECANAENSISPLPQFVQKVFMVSVLLMLFNINLEHHFFSGKGVDHAQE